MKPLTFCALCVALTILCRTAVFADSCDQRFTTLNERFAAAYINLDAECYPQPSNPDGTTSSSDSQGGGDGSVPGGCGFELSAECRERYDALSTAVGEAWNAFYAECPGYFTMTPISSASGKDSIGGSGPVRSAPTKQQMLGEIKTLKKSVKKLRRDLRAANRKLTRQCRK
ncbi:MAG: hypothetical protein EBZ48_12215 [Proteobacteria bacterium]|nr:hypothetical protein [Pseudomonadota bacterium]